MEVLGLSVLLQQAEAAEILGQEAGGLGHSGPDIAVVMRLRVGQSCLEEARAEELAVWLVPSRTRLSVAGVQALELILCAGS